MLLVEVGRTAQKTSVEGPACPQCSEAMERQDWDGINVDVCPSCSGSFFEPGGLEHMLDKLRGDSPNQDIAVILQEFQQRRGGTVGRTVRYKPCPVCTDFMVRRNYAQASGIVVDVCGKHGTWTDQATFGELTEFVSRGGDAFVRRSPLRR